MLVYILLATIMTSLISLVGAIVFMNKSLKNNLHYLISFAAGSLLAASFFHLIPEGIESFEEIGFDMHTGLLFVLIGVLIFFFIERFIHWHHCGKDVCHRKPAGSLSLVGDFVHNFIDGLLIAGAFLVDFTTGFVTTIVVILHEIPQEIGDYSILIKSGFSSKQALKLNFLTALTAVLGGVIGYFVFSLVKNSIPFLVSITAGGFIYIALSDIVPELHEHKHNKYTILIESIIFILTVLVLYFMFNFIHLH